MNTAVTSTSNDTVIHIITVFEHFLCDNISHTIAILKTAIELDIIVEDVERAVYGA